MGWGTYLALYPGPNPNGIRKAVTNLTGDVTKFVQARAIHMGDNLLTGAIVLPVVVGTDCGFDVRCERCGDQPCAGCGEQYIVDLRPTEPRMVCCGCLGMSIWAFLDQGCPMGLLNRDPVHAS